MLFSHYEKPEGWTVYSPEVLVHHAIIDDIGMPAVDYDSLTELTNTIVGNDTRRPSSIRLHPIPGRANMSGNVNVLGYYRPYSTHVHVDASASERALIHDAGTVSVIAHELQHLADYTNRPLLTAAESVLNEAFFLGRAVTALTLSQNFDAYAAYKKSSIERRAFSREDHSDITGHQQAILFPRAQRTFDLLHQRQLRSDTIRKLGLAEGDLEYAVDYVRPKSWFRRLLESKK